MSRNRSDLEQLEGILQQFNPEVIQTALGKLQETAYPIKSYKDFGDPGRELNIGEDSRVAIEDMAYLERIIAEPNFLPAHFLEEGADVQKAVARVTLTEDYAGLTAGSGWGTGFLVAPSLFMTNNHVIPTDSFSHKVEMQFNYQLDYAGNPQSVDIYSADPDDVFYTNAALDFTLIRLNPHCRYVFGGYWKAISAAESGNGAGQGRVEFTPDPFGPEPPIDFRRPKKGLPIDWPVDIPKFKKVCTNPGHVWGYLPLRESISYAGPSGDLPGQHVNIIQHPRGRRKEVSLQRNNLTNIYENVVRYTSDTEPGSSGSPVFNNQWDLISIHHAAGERDPVTHAWISNEGMRIDKIAADLISHYSGTTTGDQILTELGLI
ncbi:MAG: serine protease [Candidatus Thiodiazotropha sp.]